MILAFTCFSVNGFFTLMLSKREPVKKLLVIQVIYTPCEDFINNYNKNTTAAESLT